MTNRVTKGMTDGMTEFKLTIGKEEIIIYRKNEDAEEFIKFITESMLAGRGFHITTTTSYNDNMVGYYVSSKMLQNNIIKYSYLD